MTQPSATEPVINIRDLTFAYQGSPVLDGISLTVEANDYVAILGPNGSGKTTLLKILLGLLTPQHGSVTVLGKTPDKSRGLIGYVPQFPRFDVQFPIRVLDVVLMGRLRRNIGFGSYLKSDRAIAQAALDRMEIGVLSARQISTLSGGQLQRVLIARALAQQPKILLLDEPTASLDTKIGREFYDLLNDLSREVTVILVTHDIGVISKHVRSVACLNRKLFYHPSKSITPAILEEIYGCPVDLLAHGHPHRVLGGHSDGGGENHSC